MPRETSHKANELPIWEVPTDKPIITLDIDGVLNAFDYGRRLHSWQRPIEEEPALYRINHSQKVVLPVEMCDEYGYLRGRSFVITWSDELMADIAEVARTGEATLVWLTSWNAYADFLGWKCFWRKEPSPVLGYVDSTNGDTRSSYVGKVKVLDALCERMLFERPDNPLPVIAFDDDQPWDSKRWDGSGMMPGFFHGIATDPRHGITKSQWDGVLGILGGN